MKVKEDLRSLPLFGERIVFLPSWIQISHPPGAPHPPMSCHEMGTLCGMRGQASGPGGYEAGWKLGLSVLL